jgi:DNA-binding NtrC family response regulator
MKSKGKVFLLDDEDLIVSVLSKALKREGYEVYAETETEDVIDKIKSWDPDVILLDIRMPDRNGMDILKELKGDGINAQVVMLTADDTADTAVKAMKFGAADVTSLKKQTSNRRWITSEKPTPRFLKKNLSVSPKPSENWKKIFKKWPKPTYPTSLSPEKAAPARNLSPDISTS